RRSTSRQRFLPRLVGQISLVLACAFAFEEARATPEIPGGPQVKSIAIVGATVYPVSSAPIENGTVLFQEGRIVAVGPDVEVPEDAEVIQAEGKHVYPALFDSQSPLGLMEIGAVRA